MNIKNLLIFGSGLIVGGGTGYFVCNHFWKKKVKKIVCDQVNRIIDASECEDEHSEDMGEPDTDVSVDPVIHEVTIKSKKILESEIEKDKLLENNGFVFEKVVADGIIEDEGYVSELNKNIFKNREEFDKIIDEGETVMDTEKIPDISIISQEEFKKARYSSDYEQKVLYYFLPDDVVLDDDETEYTSTDFGDDALPFLMQSSKHSIFVRNVKQRTMYKIEKVRITVSEWQDEMNDEPEDYDGCDVE